jgi:methylaspartate mutase sigma subunit
MMRCPAEAGPEPHSHPHSPARSLSVVVSSVASDSHTWNLVYLQLAIQELGHRVHNLGACVPDGLLVAECLRIRPELVVISTVNGHGAHDGARLIAAIRARPELADTPVVIGGMLGISGPGGRRRLAWLREAGFDGVFEADAGMTAFQTFTRALSAGSGR